MTDSLITSKINTTFLRTLALFAIVFFLVATLLASFIVIPKFNDTLDAQHIEDAKTALEVEAELFERFLLKHRVLLANLAKNQVVTEAALQSNYDSADLINLFQSFSLLGEKSQLSLGEVNGDLIYQTNQYVQADLSHEERWFSDLVDEERPYYFRLLGQRVDQFRFLLAVPVLFQGDVKAILSAQIMVPTNAVFSRKILEQGNAIRMRQGDVVIRTPVDLIQLPHEASIVLAEYNVEITYVRDSLSLLQEKNRLRNLMFAVLFTGLAISFILFTLLGYSAFGANSRHLLQRKSWANRAYLVPAFVATVGIATSLAAYKVLDNIHRQNFERELLLDNEQQTYIVKRAIRANLHKLGALKGYFDSSSIVSREAFETFTDALTVDGSHIRSLAWIPKVPSRQRESYEARAREDGFENFTFKQRLDDSVVNAVDRKNHFPVFYIEPYEGNEKTLGFDLSANPQRLEELTQSMRGQKAVATAPFEVVEGNQTQAGVIVFSPVNQQKNVVGFVAAAIKVRDVVNYALAGQNFNTDIYLEDYTDVDNTKVLFGQPPNENINDNYILSSEFNMAGRNWRMISYPAVSLNLTSSSLLALSALLVGLLFTFLITLTIVQLIRRRQEIEFVVKKRTREIEAARGFQELVFNNIPDLIFVKNEKFEIVQANTPFLDLYPESDRSSVIGTTTVEAYDPEEAQAFLYYDRVALRDGMSEVEETIQFPDGERRTFETKKLRFKNEGRSYILGLARDITRSRQLEAESRALNNAMESTVEGISQVDHQGRYVYVNEAYANNCGYKVDELVAKTWTFIVHKEDLELVQAAYKKMLVKGKAVEEARGVKKDGTIFHGQITMVSQFDDEGTLVGHHCFMVDISDRKLAEERLFESNMELSRFAYVASHDLQEPLRMVASFTQLLDEEYGHKLNEEAQSYIKFITDGAKHARLLIEDLLSYASLENNEAKLELIDCFEECSKVIESYSKSLDGIKANIRLNRLPTIEATPLQINRLFQNLISNAIKYSSESRPLQVVVDCEELDNSWLFSVSDNGIGIKEEYLDQVFIIFKRLHDKKRYQGTGIGLAICQKVVESLGGKIWVESTVDQGTTFWFTIPKQLETHVKVG